MACKITIISDGAMATACALLLDHQGHRVTLWSPFPDYLAEFQASRVNSRYLPDVPVPESICLTADARAALDRPDVIVSATPTPYLRKIWQQLRSLAPLDVPICSVTKGIEQQTLMRPTQIIRDVLGDVPVVALSGPSIAPELARRLPATVVVAAEQTDLCELIQKTFSTDWLRVYTNPDMLGVELAGATKNVIALAAGIIDGLGAGDNAKAALLTRGLVEITRLGTAMGARSETFAGLAGLGDLVTTCISPVGRNRSAGQLIGQGRSLEKVIAGTHHVIEGVNTTRSVVRLAEQHRVDMPITLAVHAVLFEGLSPRQGITELMTRRLKAEVAPRRRG